MTGLERHHARMARIDAAVASVAEECGITGNLVQYVWFNATRDGESVVRMGGFLQTRKVGALRGSAVALRHGLIETPREGHVFASREWRATLTPLGKRVLWRIIEATRDGGK